MKAIKVFLFVVFCMLFMTVNQAFSASQGMKLYRNSIYNFSIEVPNYMSYKTPLLPDTIMLASTQDFTMCVIVKPAPTKFSNDSDLNYLLSEQLSICRGNSWTVLEYDIVNLPRHRVLYQAIVVPYNYPEVSFKLTQYTFQFVRNWKYYCVSYSVIRGKEHLYQTTIRKSIDSLIVD